MNVSVTFAMPRHVIIRRLVVKANNEDYDSLIHKIVDHPNQRRSKRAGPPIAKVDNNVLTLTLFVERRKRTHFRLTFQEALDRRNFQYTHMIYLNLNCMVRDFNLQYLIHDARGIRFLNPANTKRAYLHKEGRLTKQGFSKECIDSFERIDGNTFKIVCLYGSKLRGPSHMFGLEYDVVHKENGNLILKDDHFMHSLELGNLSSSSCKEVMFALDLSPNLGDEVFEKVLTALDSILDRMHSGDRVGYTTGEDLQAMNENSGLLGAHDSQLKIRLRAALMMGLQANRQNITDALKSAILKIRQTNSSRSCIPMIMLISGGSSLGGRTDTLEILEQVGAENIQNFPIFSLVLGNFTHFTFFERLSNENYGFLTKIYDTDDLNLQITNAYKEISRAATTSVQIVYPRYTLKSKTVTGKTFPFVLNGTEALICGEFIKRNYKTISFDFTAKYKNGRGESAYSSTLLRAKEFHEDSTAETLKMLRLHVMVKHLFAHYHRLRVGRREELEAVLTAIAVGEQLLIPSLTKLRLGGRTSKRFEGFSFSHNDSVATAELTVGEPGDPKPPADRNRDQSLGKNHRRSRKNRKKRRNCKRTKPIHKVVLSVVTFTVPEQYRENQPIREICMVPRNWACSYYLNLVEYKNGTDVSLAQDNGEKTSRRIVHPFALLVSESSQTSDPLGEHRETTSDPTDFRLGGTDKWKILSQDSSHETTNTSRNEMTISTPSLKITLKRVCKKSVMSIAIHISPGRFFDVTKLSGGLLINYMNLGEELIQKFTKKRAKAKCKRTRLGNSLVAVIAGTNGSKQFCKKTV